MADDALPAGEFGAWLAAMRSALRDDGDSDVACGDCSACCTSAYFVTLRPGDEAARRHVPAELLVEAPGGPAGTRLLGYDARGHCPMLRDGRCSIYAHRPQACRTYDCRVYAAAGLDPGKPAIAARVRRWRFEYADERAQLAHDAVRTAARFLRDDAPSFPRGRAPDRPPEVAVMAVKVYEAFVGTPVPDDSAGKRRLAARVVELARAFDASSR